MDGDGARNHFVVAFWAVHISLARAETDFLMQQMPRLLRKPQLSRPCPHKVYTVRFEIPRSPNQLARTQAGPQLLLSSRVGALPRDRARTGITMKKGIHPKYMNTDGQMRLRQFLHHAQHRAGNEGRYLQRLPSVLYRQAEIRRYGRAASKNSRTSSPSGYASLQKKKKEPKAAPAPKRPSRPPPNRSGFLSTRFVC